MKVLLLYPSDLGEVIFLSPVVRALKAQIDPVDVHAVVPSEILFAFTENPYIDRVVPAGVKLIQILKKEAYDLVFDCSGDNYVSLICRLTGVKRISYGRQEWKNWLMTALKINKLPGVHLVERMKRMLDPIGFKPDDLGLDYFIPEADRVPPQWLPEEFRSRFVVFFISARYATRKLPLERVIELCDKINNPIVLLGHKEDQEEGAQIQRFFEPGQESQPFEEGLKALNKRTRVFNGVGVFNPNQVASLARQASVVFTYDSEMVPMASAFRKHVYLVLGNTIPLFGRYPYHTQFTLLENTGVDCRPCSVKGFNACPRGHFKCMRKISFDFYLRQGGD